MQQKYAGSLFFAICAILLAIGCISIYSASYVYAFERGLSPAYYLYKQIIGIIIASFVGITIITTPSTLITRIAPYMFLAACVATAATIIPGFAHTIHGARRWLMIGPFSVQPGELLKVCTIWYMSYFLDKKQFTMNDLYHTCIPAVTIIVCATLLLIMQPDFGQAVTLGVTCLLLLYIFELPYRYLISLSGIGVSAIIALIIHAPYRVHRIISFLNPWNDPHGNGFQIIQSLIAIGNGGFCGQGITYSQQKYFYLPMHHTDFIFSIFAEETGYIGTTILIMLFATLLYSGYHLAFSFTHRIERSFTLGYTLLLTIQALANISVTLGILPTKGLGLPFISYGSSALIAHAVALGIIIQCWNTSLQKGLR